MPLALYLFMVVLSAQLFIGYGLSIFVGYLFTKGLLDRLRPSSAYLQSLEAEGRLLHRASRQSGWFTTGSHESWVPVNAHDTIVRDTHQPQTAQSQGQQGQGQQPSGFSMFGRSPAGYQPVATANDEDSTHNPVRKSRCTAILVFYAFPFLFY
jgi:hypothetical protein